MPAHAGTLNTEVDSGYDRTMDHLYAKFKQDFGKYYQYNKIQ